MRPGRVGHCRTGRGRLTLSRQFGLYLIAILMGLVSPALAQPRGPASSQTPAAATPAAPANQAIGEDLNAGKSAVQMFNSDCSVCHKSSRGLAKDRNPTSLAGFLRQHYTTGSIQATALAGFLASGGVAGEPEPRGARPTPARTEPAAVPGRGVKPDDGGTRRARRSPEDVTPDADDGLITPPEDGAKPADKPAEQGKRKPPKPEEASKPEEPKPGDSKPAATARERRAPNRQAVTPAPAAKPQDAPASSGAAPANEKAASPPSPPPPEIPL